MLGKKMILRFISLLLVVVLLWQVSVYAGDTIDKIASAVTIVLGVALVATGVGAAVMAGSMLAPAWGTATVVGGIAAGTLASDGIVLVIAGDQWSRREEVRDSYGGGVMGDPPMPPIDSPSSPNAPRDIKNLRFSIEIKNTYEKNKKLAVIQLKDISDGANITSVPGYGFFVSHSSSQVKMIIGSSQNGIKSQSVDNSRIIAFSDIPDITVSGVPAIVRYVLQRKSQFVRLEVLDSSGSVVYALSESAPNPAKPMPFVWNGKDMAGKNVPAGTYSLRLKAVKEDGTAEYSPISVMNVESPIEADKEKEIIFNSEGKAYVTFINTSGLDANDFIFMKLKDNNGNIITQESKVVGFGGDENAPIVTQRPLSFSVKIADVIENVKVKVEISKPNDGSAGTIKVISFYGSPEENSYELNLSNNIVKMSTRTKTEIYTLSDNNLHKKQVYYSILNLMQNLIKRIYSKKGIDYDPKTNTLAFSPELAKKISAATTGDIISLTTSFGRYSYDVSQNAITVIEGAPIGGGVCEWDENNNIKFTPDAVSATGISKGIKAMYSGLENDQTLPLFSVPLPFTFKNFQFRMDVARKDVPEEIYPMKRPQEPTIEDINWINRGTGVVKIEGTADMLNSRIELVINNTKQPVTSTSSKTWTFTNYARPLNLGENKINVIATSRDGGQVESGDVTVYLGDGNKPDLILLSPRDRQVFEETGFPFERKDFKLIGNTVPRATILAFGDSTIADTNGNFTKDFRAKDLREGANNVSILITGSENILINKTVIGAYKFVNGSKTNAYVLRKGDFTFNKGVGLGMNVKGGFDWVPFDPDHTGIYMGDGKIREAVWNYMKTSTLRDDNTWNGDSFYAATQIPILIQNEEQVRSQVTKDIEEYLSQHPNIGYDIPFLNIFSFMLLGHYNGPENGFYCSELAWWGWKKQGIDFGVKKADILFPPEPTFYEGLSEDKDTYINSILPAYFCEKTMKVKEVIK